MSSVMPRCRNALIALSAATLVAACGGGSSTSMGSLSVGITDMPVDDAERVVIAVAGLAIKPEGGAPEVLEISSHRFPSTCWTTRTARLPSCWTQSPSRPAATNGCG